MRYWTKVTATLDSIPEDWAPLANAFDEAGISGTLQTDHPPTIAGYAFEPETSTLSSLSDRLTTLGAARIETESVEEEDWAEGWKQFFKPRAIGNRFIVRPTWEACDSEGRIEIVLDPGQAFGTGDHPTTRMCLCLMEDLDWNSKQVADIGCGSGILSVAALKLGADRVVGVEIESAAVESARENATRNSVEYQVHQGAGFEPLEGTWDIVLSNIISAAILRLVPDAALRIRPGGYWVVSGIIVQNWPDVQAAAESAGFTTTRILEEDGWIGAILRR